MNKIKTERKTLKIILENLSSVKMKWLISRAVLRSNGAKTMQNVGDMKLKRVIHRGCKVIRCERKVIRCECKAVLNILLHRIQ